MIVAHAISDKLNIGAWPYDPVRCLLGYCYNVKTIYKCNMTHAFWIEGILGLHSLYISNEDLILTGVYAFAAPCVSSTLLDLYLGTGVVWP